MKSLIKPARREEGFTLIELLVVVVIIGILIAIAIPLYLNYENGAKNKSTASDLRGSISAIEQCYANTRHLSRQLLDRDRCEHRNTLHWPDDQRLLWHRA